MDYATTTTTDSQPHGTLSDNSQTASNIHWADVDSATDIKDNVFRSKSWKKTHSAITTSKPNNNSKSLLQNQPFLKELFTSASSEDCIIVNTNLIHKQNDKLVIWNIKTGECSLIFTGHTADITAFAAINPDSDNPRMLSSSSKETLLWELMTGKFVKNFTSIPKYFVADPHRDNRVALYFPDSGKIETWDFGRHRTTPSVVTLIDGDVPCISVAYFRKRQKLAAGYSDKSIRIWNLLSNECELTLKEDQDIVSVFPTRDHIISITVDGYCHIWPILTAIKSKKVLSQRISSPLTHGVKFLNLFVNSGTEGFSLEDNILLVKGSNHFPDSYKLTSLDTIFRVTDREQVIIGQFNTKTYCFVISKEG
jgi:WD40 repeat protein